MFFITERFGIEYKFCPRQSGLLKEYKNNDFLGAIRHLITSWTTIICKDRIHQLFRSAGAFRIVSSFTQIYSLEMPAYQPGRKENG